MSLQHANLRPSIDKDVNSEAARAEADSLFSVCFQVCGSFEAGAEKPASDDAGTGKRLEPETGFCTVLTSAATIVKRVQKAAQILT